jgi:hypothetical protein
MSPRRKIAATIGVTALLIAHPGWYARATESGEQAVTFVKSTSDQLIAVANSAGSPQERHRQLQDIIDSNVDVHDIARFCLGRFWAIATADQKKEYATLFHDLLVRKIAAHLGEYQGVRVTMGLSRASADTEIVITKVDRLGYQHCHWRPKGRRSALGGRQSEVIPERGIHLLSCAPPIQHRHAHWRSSREHRAEHTISARLLPPSPLCRTWLRCSRLAARPQLHTKPA